MADINIQMKNKIGETWNKLFPKTKIGLVEGLPAKLDDVETRLNAAATKTEVNTKLAVVGEQLADIAINVKTFGAIGDGNPHPLSEVFPTLVTAQMKYPHATALTNQIDWCAIQGAANSIISGEVFVPKGVYRTHASIELTSDICLKGSGWTSTFIKLTDDAVIPTNTGMVQSKNFLPDRNVWEYYEPYPTGLYMGISLEDITLDGNKDHQSTGCGLCLYGGKWTLNRVGIINTVEHGIWTECGIPGDSTAGSDLENFLNMHESTAEQVFICNTGKFGWNFRGANDSYINNVQIKLTGWDGFSCPIGATFSSSGLKIGTMHLYGTNLASDDPSGYCAELSGTVMADRIYIDSPAKNGVKLGSASHINRIYVLARNPNAIGAYWGLVIEGSANTILSLKINDSFYGVTTPVDGGGVWIKSSADRNVVNINMFGQNNTGVVSTGVLIEGNYNDVSGVVSNLVSGVGLTVAGAGNDIDLIARNCNYGYYYKNAIASAVKWNRINISTVTCTHDTLKDVDYDNEDITVLSSAAKPIHFGDLTFANRAEFNWLELTDKTLASAASYTFADNAVAYYQITLNQNSTINAPTITANIGRIITIRFIQDATGARTVTWNAAFKTSWSNPDSSPGAAFKRCMITFIWDGSFWVEQSRTTWI